jgi:hypothetical protein
MGDPTRPVAIHVPPAGEGGSWGWLPGLCVACSCGILLVSYANFSSRAGAQHPELLYWLGLLLLVVPISARLVGVTPTRFERIGLVMILGMAFYLVKITHSPFAFTFPDELVHAYNAQAIVEHNELFTSNPILAVTTFYPGLEIITAAAAMLAGLPLFATGLIVIGIARLVLMLALFLLYEQVSGSARAASLGVLLFAGSSNFVYWSVQYSYESLSMPLAVLLLYAVGRRFYTPDGRLHPGLTLAILLTLLAVVVTHHLTSYAVLVFLAAVGLIQAIFRSTRTNRIGPWGLVLIAFLATATWLVYVGNQAVAYIYPVFRSAGKALAGTVAGDEAPRALFTSNSGAISPLWERVVGLGSVGLLFLGLLVGLHQVWKHARSNAMAIVLGGAALAYFPLLGLRFTPAGWEISNRATNYLFIGLAMVAGLAAARIWSQRRAHILIASLFPVCAVIVILGGLIAGWPPDMRLSRPYRVGDRLNTTDPQGVAAASWAVSRLGPGNRIATDETNARLMLAYGDQYVLTGPAGGIRIMLLSSYLSDSDLQILQAGEIDYVVYDKRSISWNNMRGIYYGRKTAGSHPQQEGFLDELVYSQFDGVRYVSKLLDSGYVAIYDVGVLSGAKPIP